MTISLWDVCVARKLRHGTHSWLLSDSRTPGASGLVGQTQDGETKVRRWALAFVYVDLEIAFGLSLFAQYV